MPELKPCPFCGGEPMIYDIEPYKHLLANFPDHPGSTVIECGCGCGLVDESRETVIERWNTRADSAAVAAEREAWKPIETAPRDGTVILLGSRGGCWIGKWLQIYGSGYRPENPWSSLMLNHNHMGEKWMQPTHWMPLPQPPRSAHSAKGGE